MPIAVPDAVSRRAESLGEPGLAWLRALPAEVAALEADWGVRIGAVLSGGTEALVALAHDDAGGEAVLKLGLPGAVTRAGEIRTLELAQGRGYARLLRCDPERRALLLERLGSPLSEQPIAPGEQMRILCALLRRAWIAVDAPEGAITGAEKAQDLADFIVAQQRIVAAPWPAPVIERALAFAADRRAAYDSAAAVRAHGDCHPGNALAAPDGGFKFVDPDGLFIEPAYDAGVLLREWTQDLLADPAARGQARCAALAAETGAPAHAIWRWGFIECVSTGLLLETLPVLDPAPYRAIATAWAAIEPPP